MKKLTAGLSSLTLRACSSLLSPVLLTLGTTGCILHLPDHCHKVSDTRGEEQRMLESFDEQSVAAGSCHFTVFTPKANRSHPHGPPVLVLHEMPVLSPDVLNLGLRLADEGYSIYIPLLWGLKMRMRVQTSLS